MMSRTEILVDVIMDWFDRDGRTMTINDLDDLMIDADKAYEIESQKRVEDLLKEDNKEVTS